MSGGEVEAFLKPLIASPDLTEGNRLSTSKALLSFLAAEQGQTELQLFESYFKPFTIADEDCNISALERSTGTAEKAVKWFYRFSSPSEHPQYFNFNYYHDLNKLGSVLNLELVIYAVDSVVTPSWIQPHHDFRGVSSPRDSRKAKYFLYDTRKRLVALRQSADVWFEEHPPIFAAYDSRPTFWATNGFDSDHPEFFRESGDCFKCIAERTLGIVSPVYYGCRAEGNLRILRLADFIGLGSQLYREWKVPVLIVTFCCQEKTGGATRLALASKFTTLCCVSEGGSSAEKVADWNLKGDQIRVLCFFSERFACLLSPAYQKAVIQRHYDTVTSSSKSSKEGKEAADLKKLITKEKREEAIQALEQSKSAYQKRLNRLDKFCKCETCTDKKFDLNMSWAGPEKLISTKYTIKDLLELLGAWNPFNESILDKLSESSLASMDIESKTLELSAETPKPGPQVPYAEIDSSQLRSHMRKIQKPLMIAHTDGLCPEMGVFAAAEDSEQAIYDMMGSYWNFVLESHLRTSAYKLALAKPLYNLVEPYKLKFFEVAEQCSEELWQFRQSQEQQLVTEYCVTGDKTLYDEGLERLNNSNLNLRLDTSEVCAAWKQSLPGQLEQALDHLVKSYVIFSFYG